jgi:hypothetical protein
MFWCRPPEFLADPRSASELARVANELAAARFHWHGAMVLLVVMIVATVIYTGLRLWGAVRAHRELRAGVVGGVILVGAVAAWVFGGKGGAHIALAPLLDVAPGDIAESAQALATVTRAITTFAAVLVAVGACASLAGGSDRLGGGRVESGAQVARQVKALEGVLVVGAAVLVAALVEYRAFISWIAWYASDFESLSKVGSAVLAANGITYTLLLGAVYASASAVLRQRAADIVANALPEGTAHARAEWLDREGIAFSWPTALRTGVAVLAPFLVGSPLARVLAGLGS